MLRNIILKIKKMFKTLRKIILKIEKLFQNRPELHRRVDGQLLLQPRQEGRQAPLLVHHPLPGHHGAVRHRPSQVQGGEQHYQTLDP